MLICDFAEEYGILDYRAIRPFLAGTLAYGLKPDSRIRMKMAGIDLLPTQMLMTRAVDELAVIRWLNTQDGVDGVNRPVLLTQSIIPKKDDNAGYDTPEEFMRSYYAE